MMQVVRNKQGQVALCHYQPVSIVADVGAKKYNFEYRNHVVLAWVEQDGGTRETFSGTAPAGLERAKEQELLARWRALPPTA